MKEIHEILQETWPEWQLDAPIGQGAYARVFRIKKETEGETRFSALKVMLIPDDWENADTLRAEGRTEEDIEEYYAQQVSDCSAEITIMQSLQGNQHIVSIEDFRTLHPESLQWIILIRMELLTPLMKASALNGYAESDVIRLGLELSEALDDCHRRHILHRDIKPENIFVAPDGSYKLGDFGTAKRMESTTGDLSWKGTPNFMAPEVYQAVGGTNGLAGKRGDIYSLGMVLYWMGNGGRLPFVPDSRKIATAEERKRAFLRRIGGDPLPPPVKVSPGLTEIILKACAHKPEDRFDSAKDLHDALAGLTLQDHIKKKRWSIAWIITSVVLAFAAGVGLMLWHPWQSKEVHPVPAEASNSIHAETEGLELFEQIVTANTSQPVSDASTQQSDIYAGYPNPTLMFPDKDQLNIYVFFSEEAWFGSAQSALWEAMRDTPCEEKWIGGMRDTLGNQSIDQYFERILCETLGLWDTSLSPWDPEEWPLADAVLIFAEDDIDYSPVIEKLIEANVPVYVFQTTDPEIVRQNYLGLYLSH